MGAAGRDEVVAAGAENSRPVVESKLLPSGLLYLGLTQALSASEKARFGFLMMRSAHRLEWRRPAMRLPNRPPPEKRW